jgi:threonine dehydrogenase-like Zn-dependent dehydrogenase
MYVREDVTRAMELLRTLPFALEDFVTAQFELEQASDAFRAADNPEHVKVLVLVESGG